MFLRFLKGAYFDTPNCSIGTIHLNNDIYVNKKKNLENVTFFRTWVLAVDGFLI